MRILFHLKRLFRKGVKTMNVQERIDNPKVYDCTQIIDFLESIGRKLPLIKNNKKISYYNVPASFDIETTSFTRENQVGTEKCSIMYEWTLGINFSIIVGRTWEEFLTVYNALVEWLELTEDYRLIIYCHNLSFEFQAIKRLLEWQKVFALEPRKPVQAITKQGVEFRCSYILSGYSLENLGNKILRTYKVQKMVGDLDYSKSRSPLTPLTDKEWKYCINDVLVVMAYILECIAKDGGIHNIPLTKTGYVRRYCRDRCYYADKTHRKNTDKYHKYRNLMKDLTITPSEYVLLKEAFGGGFTHANPYNSMGIFHNVGSADETSAYPAVIVSEKFPMSKGVQLEPIESYTQLAELCAAYCIIMRVRFTGIKSELDYENYISVSHCHKLQGYTVNNGRLVRAKMIEISITNVDLDIISKFYSWEDMEVLYGIKYRKDYLPTDFVKSVLDLYVSKTELKGIAGREVEYGVSKENINSAYGMMVTDICRDEITYDEVWLKETPDIEEAISKYNKSKRRFLFYPWGVFVTAYARHNLFTAIVEFNDDYIYSDTDSVKGLNFDKHMEYFNTYNNVMKKKLLRAMKHHNLPDTLVHPKTINGEEKWLGVWEIEGIYDMFKTLGAKRYMTYKDRELSLTVSGINKKKAVPYLLEKYTTIQKVFENFDNNLYIPPDYTGSMVHTYIDEEIDGIIVDYLGNEYVYHEMSGTHLMNREYSLNITDNYLDYLKELMAKATIQKVKEQEENGRNKETT